MRSPGRVSCASPDKWSTPAWGHKVAGLLHDVGVVLLRFQQEIGVVELFHSARRTLKRSCSRLASASMALLGCPKEGVISAWVRTECSPSSLAPMTSGFDAKGAGYREVLCVQGYLRRGGQR